MKFLVFSHDPLQKYVNKGEIKLRYWNANDMWDEVHIVDFTNETVRPENVQELAGQAKLTIHEIRPRHFWKIPFLQKKVDKIINQVKPDIIRIHAFNHIGVLAFKQAGKLGIPTVVSVHGDNDDVRKYNRAFRYKIARYFERFSFRNAGIVFCVTDAMQSFAYRNGAQNAVTVFNKVYTSQFYPKETYHLLEENKLNVFCVMRMEIPNKDPLTLIKAVKNCPFVKLHLVGSGPDNDQVDSLIKSLQLENKITRIKTIPNKDIQHWYNKMDCFAMSTNTEGFCIPILEAMAAGLPIISSNTIPIPEVLGGTGILIEKTPGNFATEFEKIFSDINYRKNLGIAARKRALTIDGTAMENLEEQIFRDLMNGIKPKLHQ